MNKSVVLFAAVACLALAACGNPAQAAVSRSEANGGALAIQAPVSSVGKPMFALQSTGTVTQVTPAGATCVDFVPTETNFVNRQIVYAGNVEGACTQFKLSNAAVSRVDLPDRYGIQVEMTTDDQGMTLVAATDGTEVLGRVVIYLNAVDPTMSYGLEGRDPADAWRAGSEYYLGKVNNPQRGMTQSGIYGRGMVSTTIYPVNPYQQVVQVSVHNASHVSVGGCATLEKLEGQIAYIRINGSYCNGFQMSAWQEYLDDHIVGILGNQFTPTDDMIRP